MGFGKDHKGVIIRRRDTQTLGAMAGQTATVSGGLATKKDFRLLKSEISVVLTDLTAGEADGLLLFLANGELTSAEVIECLEADGPLDRSDELKAERAERQVWPVATYEAKDITSTHGIFKGRGGDSLIIVKPRWTFSEVTGWQWGVYNNGNAITTGAAFRFVETAYGVWV